MHTVDAEAGHVPMALAELHRATAVGEIVAVRVRIAAPRARDVLEGAGFEVVSLASEDDGWLTAEATRARTLADTVGPGMRLLVVGLNPSVYSADAGHGFARPGNRFWPAAVASGLVSRAHDPLHALSADRVGMTDLVKRATARADALARDEYRAGADRVDRLVEWLQPAAVCFVGLAGYRAAIDRTATAGWQGRGVGGVPTYLMPNTSGINAHATAEVLTDHLRRAQRAPTTPP